MMRFVVVTPRRRRGWLRALAALLVAAGSLGSLGAHAETRIGFFAHAMGLGPSGFLYFPHAFVLIERDTDLGAATESYGFTAASQNLSVLLHSGPGAVRGLDPTYTSVSQRLLTVAVTDAQYTRLRQVVAAWSTPPGGVYRLRGHNCITFVAEIAASIGLRSPDPLGLDPRRYLERLRAANPERIVPPGTTPAVAKAAAIAPAGRSDAPPADPPGSLGPPAQGADPASPEPDATPKAAM